MGYKINTQKSAVYLQTNKVYMWKAKLSKKTEYLGIQIHTYVWSIYVLNIIKDDWNKANKT